MSQIVPTKTVVFNEPFQFVNGKIIPQLNISYHTYGTLNQEGTNAILICHYFSGNKHVAGVDSKGNKGWWDSVIGPGKAIDTSQYFVISSDSLCCMHTDQNVTSSGPKSTNPVTGKPYGLDFPVTTIEDMVNAQKILMDYLGVRKLKAVMGPSMGGLQSIQWAISYPDFVEKVIPVAAAPKLDGFACMFPLRLGMQCIQTDPLFNNGDYYDSDWPMTGLKNAISQLAVVARGRDWCDDILAGRKFDQEPNQDLNNMFKFESQVLNGVASRADEYDPNSYLYICKANLLFDPFSLNEEQVFSRLKSDFLLIAETGDIFILPAQIREFYWKIRHFRPNSRYHEFSSPLGHLGSVDHAKNFEEHVAEFLNGRTHEVAEPSFQFL